MSYTTHEIARVCHEANRALQAVQGDPARSGRWGEVPEEQRDSACEGVRTALDGATPEELHENWCDFKRAAGWTHGPVKDADAKTHPCLVDYDDLPAGQQDKDRLFQAIVSVLGEVQYPEVVAP